MCGRPFTATWVGLDLFSEFPVSLLNVVGSARSSYFCTVKKNHWRQRRKAMFLLLLRVAESLTTTAGSAASESVSILTRECVAVVTSSTGEHHLLSFLAYMDVDA